MPILVAESSTTVSAPSHIPTAQLPIPSLDPLQVICLGKSPYMGMVISQHFYPRLWFKHYLTPEEPCADLLGCILTTQTESPSSDANAGASSGGMGRVDAVLFGMGWEQVEVDEIFAKVKQDWKSRRSLPWLGPSEMKKLQPALESKQPTLAERSAFAKVVAGRVLAVLDKLKEERKLDQEEFHYF